MEFIYFIIFIYLVSLFFQDDKKTNSENTKKSDSKNDFYDISNENNQRESELDISKIQKENWDNSFYHNVTKVHYPRFKFNSEGWSVYRVYLPKTQKNELIDIKTGDKYNELGLDFFGNKRVEVSKEEIPPKLIENVHTSEINHKKIQKTFKPMYKNINPFLDHVKVNKFYHFTDKRNLQSIIDNGGLYTWNGLRIRNINGYIASNDISHSLDKKKGLENYVRLSFANYHPMSSFVRDKKNVELIWLEIDRSVSAFEDTLFSNMNATDNSVTVSGEFDFLKKLNFSIFKEEYRSLTTYEKKQYQSEILVKDCVPLEYIVNLETLKERYL